MSCCPPSADFTDPDPLTIAAISDQALDASTLFDNARIEAFKAVLNEASHLEDAAKRLLTLAAKWKPELEARFIRKVLEVSAFAGRDAVLREMDDQFDPLAETTEMADAELINQPFKEQLEFFRQKAPRPTARWTDILRHDHDRAFMIAGAKDRDMLADFQKAIADNMENGMTLAQFRKDFDRIVGKYGWSYNGERGWRTRTIYQTNVRTSYMAGRLKQMRDPDVLRLRPYWQYRHGVTRSPKQPRAKHLAWDGLILPHDDPFWDTHFPPNDWLCSCGVRTLSKRDLERLGKAGPDTAPEILMEPVIDPATKQLTEKPQGIGFGWDYQPGDRWERGLVPSQVAYLDGENVVGIDKAVPIAALMANAVGTKARSGIPAPARGKPKKERDEILARHFLSEFGSENGEAVVFIDKTGTHLVISDELFRDFKGDFKIEKQGREKHLLQLAEALKEPDEIWLGIVKRRIPDEQGGGFEYFVDRRYIRVDPETGLLLVFEMRKGAWSAKTAYQTKAVTTFNTEREQFRKRRVGKLIYQRVEDGDDDE